MRHFKRFANLGLLTGCLILQGCHSLKTTLGIERQPPDEFAVLPNSQPLDMPPDFRELPLPRPGTPRPQEVKALQHKKQQSFGGNVLSGGQSSAGQEALLKLGGVETKQEDIRSTIDEEHHKQKGKNVLRETLGLTESKKDVLEPTEELENLKEQEIPSGRHRHVQESQEKRRPEPEQE